MVVNEGIVSKLVHKLTDYSFLFDVRGDILWSTFSPGRQKPQEHVDAKSSSGMLSMVRVWDDSLRHEIDAIDLWAEIAKVKQLFIVAASVEDADELFTDQQQQNIEEGLDEMKQLLLDHVEDSTEHQKLVSKQFDYLNDRSSRMSRTDWINTAIGVLMTIIVGASLTPDKAHELFQYLGTLIDHIGIQLLN